MPTILRLPRAARLLRLALLPLCALAASALAQDSVRVLGTTSASPRAAPASWPESVPGPKPGELKCSYMPKPDLPRAALQQNISGTVRAAALVKDGVVIDVHIFEGPPIYHATVRRTMMGYQCTGQGTVRVMQTFNFLLDQDGNISLADLCPTQPLPQLPAGLSASLFPAEVLARVIVGAGKVQEVKFFSGPAELQAPVTEALNRYACKLRSPEVYYPKFSFASPSAPPLLTLEAQLVVMPPGADGMALPQAPGMATRQRGIACRVQVRPQMPAEAVSQGISGVVKAEAVMNNGAVTAVNIISGPSVFHQAVRDAMMQYKCQQMPETVRVVQSFSFYMPPVSTLPTLRELAGPPHPPAPDPYALQGATCRQQPKPRLPAEAARAGKGGNVHAKARIADGGVKEVTILSGPEVFHQAVKDAMLAYSGCELLPGDVPVAQSFHFQPTDDDILEALCPDRPAPHSPTGLAASQFPAEVRARLMVTRGKVQEVKFVSGPEAFHGAVNEALRHYRCDEDAKVQVVYRTFRFATP